MIVVLSSCFFIGACSIETDAYSSFEGIYPMEPLIDAQTQSILYTNETDSNIFGYAKDELSWMKVSNINNLNAEGMALIASKQLDYFELQHRLANKKAKTVEKHFYSHMKEGIKITFEALHDVAPSMMFLNRSDFISSLLLLGFLIVIAISLVFVYVFKQKSIKLDMENQEMAHYYTLGKNFINADNRFVYLRDQNLKYMFMNRVMEDFYNKKANQATNNDDNNIKFEEFIKLREETDLAVLRDKRSIEDEVLWNGKVYKAKKFPIDLLNGEIGVGAYIEDITEKKHAEIERETNLFRNSILVDVFSRDYASSQQQLDFVLDRAIELTRSKYGYLFLYDNQKQELILNSWSDGVMTECSISDQQTRYALADTGLWGEAVKQSKPIIDNNLQNEGALKKGFPKGHVRLNNFMTIPIVIENKIVAVIGLANKENGYGDNDIYQITVLMTGVWNALESKEKSQDLVKANLQLRDSKEQLQLLLNSTAEGIYGIDNDGKCTFVNKSALEMLGYTRDEVIEKDMHNLIHHTNRNGQKITSEKCNIMKSLKNNSSFHVDDGTFRRKDGSYIPVEYSSHLQRQEGKVVGAVITFVDNTVRKEMEKEIFNEKEQFKTTLLSVGNGVISTDAMGNIRVFNSVAEKLTGWRQEEAIGKPFEEVFNIINEHTLEKCENPVVKVLKDKETVVLADDTILVTKDQKKIPIEDSAAPIKDAQGEVTGVVVVFRERKEQIEEIEYLSFHDHLTGLYNRKYMENSIKKLDVKGNIPLTIMSLDVNGLKLVNDAFGHKVGDQLLIKASEAIKKASSPDDIVGRLGGDEFLIFLPQTTEEQAARIKKRMLSLVSQIELDQVSVSLSIGHATKVSEDTDIKMIMTAADNQMYRDKLRYGRIMRFETIEKIIKRLNSEYVGEKRHTERVAQYSEALAKAMNLGEKEVKDMKTAGFLHDIGKIVVPPEILNKRTKLSKEEAEIMKRHPEISYQILKSVDEYISFARDVLYHHERIDGKGYPEGLKGDEIPLGSKILAVADAYEAMTSERPFQAVMTKKEAIAELKTYAGTQFDEEVVKAFIEKVLLL